MRDFAPVASLCWSPAILVVDGATGAKSMAELLQRANSNSSKVNFGGGTVATQLNGEQVKTIVGLEIVFVPTKAARARFKACLRMT